MPVIDGTFVANFELTAAERAVNWAGLNRVILVERDRIEKALAPLSKRLGFAVGAGLHSAKMTAELEQKFARHLTRVYQVGMVESRRELAALRSREAAPAPSLAARREDVGPGAARRKFDSLAGAAAADVERAAVKAAGEGEVAASSAAVKMLHHHVLLTIGLSLNYGRVEGALTARDGPPTYSMRSEQLDRSTCERCTELHGSITQVDSPEFFEGLPPSGCLGLGRCRGIAIFSDGARDLRQPEG